MVELTLETAQEIRSIILNGMAQRVKNRHGNDYVCNHCFEVSKTNSKDIKHKNNCAGKRLFTTLNKAIILAGGL